MANLKSGAESRWTAKANGVGGMMRAADIGPTGRKAHSGLAALAAAAPCMQTTACCNTTVVAAQNWPVRQYHSAPKKKWAAQIAVTTSAGVTATSTVRLPHEEASTAQM